MHVAVRSVVDIAPSAPEDVCILDLEASTEHLLVATARHADAMYAVVEPYGTSLESGRRVALLSRDLGLQRVALIANKVRGEQDVEAVTAFARAHEIELVGAIPYDESFLEADRAGLAPLDYEPAARGVRASAELAPRLLSA